MGFRKRMANKKVVVPPGGMPHPDEPMKFHMVDKESSPRTRTPPDTPRDTPRSPRMTERSSSPRPRTARKPVPGSGLAFPGLLGAACLATESPVHRPCRRQGEVSKTGFSDHMQRYRQRTVDINRYAGGDTHDAAAFRPMRRRASSCPPDIREVDGGDAVGRLVDSLASTPRERLLSTSPRERMASTSPRERFASTSPRERSLGIVLGSQSAGIASAPQREQNGKRVWPVPSYGQSHMATYMQYDPREQITSSRAQRETQDSGFAQRCRDLIKTSTFAGRVNEAVLNTNHNSNSNGVKGCFQWG